MTDTANTHATTNDETPIDDLVHTFTAFPDDGSLFRRLEERLLVEGDWNTLADVYQQRADAPSVRDDAEARVQMLLRRAQVLEERCFQPERALEVYTAALRIDPQNRVALRQLRSIHSSREQWDLVLQIAEMESQLEMEPFERARLDAELGEMWVALGDLTQAEQSFRSSLEVDPNQHDALASLARLLVRSRRGSEAVGIFERLVTVQRGPDRAAALVELGRCLAGPLELGERAAECYRRALTEDPRSHEAVEALADDAARREQWALLADLYERRFDLAAGARVRTAIAIQAAELHRDRLGNPGFARMWFERALQLSGDDPSVYRGIADMERATGNAAGLREALNKLSDLCSDLSTESLLEASALNAEAGDSNRTVAQLERALRQSPDDAVVLAALSDALTTTGRDGQRIDVLERRASHPDETIDARAGYLLQIAGIHEAAGDPDGVLEAYERALALDPSLETAATALADHYRKSGDRDALLHLLEQQSECGPESLRAACAGELGQLRLEGGESTGASEAFESALRMDPRDARALAGLAGVARASGDDTQLLHALERAAAVATRREDLEPLVLEMAPLLERNERPLEAVDWLERLLVQAPDHAEALDEIARLHRASSDDESLAGILVRIDALSSDAGRTPVRLELSEVHERLGESEIAYAWLERAASSDPADRRALDLLIERDQQSESHEPLASNLRELAERLVRNPALATSDSEEFELRTARIDVLEHQLGDEAGAIADLRPLCTRLASDHELHGRLEGLLDRTGNLDELLEQLSRRADAAEHEASSPSDIAAARRPHDLRRAELLCDRLGRFDEGADLYAALREREPGCAAAEEGLERALRAAGEHRRLASLLGDRALRQDDPRERAALRLLQAEQLELDEEGRSAAFSIYRELSSPEGRSQAPEPASQAFERLVRGLETDSDWDGLLECLQRELDPLEGSDRVDLHLRIANLCRDRMGDHVGAIDHLEAAIKIAPHASPEPWARLADLYTDCDEPANLLRALQGQLAFAPDAPIERGLRLRAARLCASELADPGGACNHYERLLDLDPPNIEAAEFLAERYERRGEAGALREVLERRLEGLESGQSDETDREARTDLRLRLAALQPDDEDGLAAASRLLDAAEAEVGCEPRVAHAQLRLCERRGDPGAIADLASRAAPLCGDEAERRIWQRRHADALREAGDLARAADAFQTLLDDGAGDADTLAVLCELHRQQGNAPELVRVLESRLVHESPDAEAERAMRLELARLLAALERPEDALPQWERAIALDPSDASAIETALQLAERLGRGELVVQLLDRRLAGGPARAERADLHERRGGWLETMGRVDEAVSAYRSALSSQPERRALRTKLRQIFESRQEWSDALAELELEVAGLPDAARRPLLERGAAIASREIGPEAALAWLERLRAAAPEDRETLARLAELHRAAGRPESVLRILDAQLAFAELEGAQRDIQVERARLFERDLGSKARAVEALEAALELSPNDNAVLRELDRLYGELERPSDRFAVIEARIRSARGSDAVALHRRAAELAAGPLTDPDAAVRHCKATLQLTSNGASSRTELLATLASAQVDARDLAGAADTFDQRLALCENDAPERTAILLELARLRGEQLGQEDVALDHWRALLDEDHELTDDQRDRVEEQTLAALRRRRRFGELETRLTASLERRPERPDAWLELARLRDEVLCRPGTAEEAAMRCVETSNGDPSGLRLLRTLRERLGRWSGVAEVLECELEALPENETHSRAATLRGIGALRMKRLGDARGALEAYEAALDLEPGNASPLAPLQDLCEELDQPESLLDYAERECASLEEADGAGPAGERAHAVWLRAARVADSRLGDGERALAAYEAAERIAPLPPDAARAHAELYDRLGRGEEFLEHFARWVERDDAEASCEDALRLGEAFAAAGREDDAARMTARACELDPESLAAWDAAADRAGKSDRAGDAADFHSRAAALASGQEAGRRWLAAAELRESESPEAALELVRRAVACDPSEANAQAARARLAGSHGHHDEAQDAASAALDLLPTSAETETDAIRQRRLEAALAGGRAAQARDRGRAALLFFGTALEIEPEHSEALAAQADLLLDAQDFENARPLLERRLELDADYRGRAHHEAMLGVALERAGELEESLSHFEAARERDPQLSEAHAGVARILEKLDRVDDATRALEGWATSDASPEERSAAWWRAADHYQAAGCDDEVMRALRGAVEAQPDAHPAAARLAELLYQQEAYDEAIAEAERAVELEPPDDLMARFACVSAQAHEALGHKRQAIDAYRRACELDPWHVDASLAAARLQSSIGEFSEAAEALAQFASRHPQPGSEILADVFAERARLLSGPLECIDAAIDAYREALERQPGPTEWQQRLAGLLAHVPQRWREAAALHREILMAQPGETSSIRALAQIASFRGRPEIAERGTGLLALLGAAAPGEHQGEALRGAESTRRRVLDDPVDEALRMAIVELRDDLERAGALSNPPAETRGELPPVAQNFEREMAAAADEYSAPGLVREGSDRLQALFVSVACVALERRDPRADRALVEFLESQVGRRTRRRVRRLTEEIGFDALVACSPERWRIELLAAAGEAALARSNADARMALLTLCEAPDPLADEENANLTALVDASPVAHTLLTRLVTRWCRSTGSL